VSMNIGGRDYTFRGTLSFVPADNLASHYLVDTSHFPVLCESVGIAWL
jgi:hypothetical protein